MQDVHFQSLSMQNLLRLGHTTPSGSNCDDLHRAVHDALTSRKRTHSPDTFQAKRRRLQNWSYFSGPAPAALKLPGEKFFPCPESICAATEVRFVLRNMAAVASSAGSVVTLRLKCDVLQVRAPMCLEFMTSGLVVWPSPSVERFSWQISGVGGLFVLKTELDTWLLRTLMPSPFFYSPNGVLYVVSQSGGEVQNLVGSRLQTVIASESLPADMKFQSCSIFVTKEEVIYLGDNLNHRIICINPAESLEPIVVGRIPSEVRSILVDLFVTEGGTIYAADRQQAKVLALHPGDSTLKSCSVQTERSLRQFWFWTDRCMSAWLHKSL
eukprot:s843_g11.t1